MRLIVFILLLGLSLSTSLSAQPITGIYKVTLTVPGKRIQQKVGEIEYKLIQKGDSIYGTGYHYQNKYHYNRYTVKGYINSATQTIEWYDDQFQLQVAPRTEKLMIDFEAILLKCQFDCPDGKQVQMEGKLFLKKDGGAVALQTKIEKIEKSIFDEDEWSPIVEGYFEGMNQPKIIDSVHYFVAADITRRNEQKQLSVIGNPQEVKSQLAVLRQPTFPNNETVVAAAEKPNTATVSRIENIPGSKSKLPNTSADSLSKMMVTAASPNPKAIPTTDKKAEAVVVANPNINNTPLGAVSTKDAALNEGIKGNSITAEATNNAANTTSSKVITGAVTAADNVSQPIQKSTAAIANTTTIATAVSPTIATNPVANNTSPSKTQQPATELGVINKQNQTIDPIGATRDTLDQSMATAITVWPAAKQPQPAIATVALPSAKKTLTPNSNRKVQLPPTLHILLYASALGNQPAVAVAGKPTTKASPTKSESTTLPALVKSSSTTTVTGAPITVTSNADIALAGNQRNSTTSSNGIVSPVVVSSAVPVIKPEMANPIDRQRILSKFEQRQKKLAVELPIVGDSIELRFYDNAEVDGDSVSLVLNNQLILQHIRLTTQPYTIKLPVNDLAAVNELTMVAENLGAIPPNTALMIAITATQRFEVRLESTEQSSAMIRLVRQIPSPNK